MHYRTKRHCLNNVTLALLGCSFCVQGFTEGLNHWWAGPWVGVYLGGAPYRANMSTTTGSVTGSSFFSTTESMNSVNQQLSSSGHSATVTGGVQAGDSWVFKQLLYGWMLDYGSFSLKTSHHANSIPWTAPEPGFYTASTSLKTDWLATLRGRIGFSPGSFGSLLIYASGGLGYTNVKLSNTFHDTSALSGMGSGSHLNTQTGWTAGAGIEFPLTPNLIVNSEYLYIRFGSSASRASVSNTLGAPGIPAFSLSSTLLSSASIQANIFRLGINYKFSEGYQAKT